ncbi:TonB-dependent receptor plug domain-containing protein [Hirschia maritima]|uniref:TonB-dependent receptor plug domain-containing protein n=1 Tax=Hirschia maritima TaxID=1121961 RepID=UPI00037B1D04|nr:TonB-dependent receptor [Hirschia maritima]
MNYKTALLSAAAATLLPAAIAQEADVDQSTQDTILVTSTRALSIEEVTSSFSIIDAEALNLRNSTLIADQLRLVPGLGISRAGAQGGLTQIRVRGGEGNHTMLLVDGIEVSSPVGGETNFGLWSGLNVDRVEIARGEQSSIYGSGAIGGVIAVTTDRDAQGGEGQIEVGSFDSYRGNVNISGNNDLGNIGFNASTFKSDGVDTSGNGGQKDGSQDQAYTVYGSLSPSDNWELSSLLGYRNAEVDFDSDTDFDGFLNDVDRSSETDQYIVGFALEADAAGIKHNARASFNQVTINTQHDGVFQNETDGKRYKLAYLPSYKFGSALKSVTVTGILDWEKTEYERVDTSTAFGDPNQQQDFKTLGFGTEVLTRLHDFILNASIRRDDNQDKFEDATTWRVGAAYNLPIDGKVRASVGTGVKNPTFTEQFGFTPASFVGNPDLKPEKSQSWEVGYDQILGPITASLTYFEADLEDEIYTSFSFNPDTFAFNSTALNRTGDSSRSGVEFALDWQIMDSLNLTTAFSDITSENDSGEDEIRVPDQTASLSLGWQSENIDGLRAGLAIDYVGEQKDKNFGTFPATDVDLDAYSLVSANVEIPVSDRLSVTLRGENLLDEKAQDIFGYHSTGIGGFVGLRLR